MICPRIFLFLIFSFAFASHSQHPSRLSHPSLFDNSQLHTLNTNLDWSSVDQVINTAIENGTMPGAVVIIGSGADGTLYSKAYGHFTYGIFPPLQQPEYPDSVPPMKMNTLFDLASLTKIFATTNAAMQFYERGELDLNWKIADTRLLGPLFATIPIKGYITVANCLTHSAGWPPDPTPEFWSKEFNCPQLSYHTPETFDCVQKAYEWTLLNQTLINPPNTKYVYSDLSMMTMAWSLGHLAESHGYVTEQDIIPECQPFIKNNIGTRYHCFYEAYVRKHVVQPMKLQFTGFRPPQQYWPFAAPTENFSLPSEGYNIFHRPVQGQVSDQNAYIGGGIMGHAGFFSIAPELEQIVLAWLRAWRNDISNPLGISKRTIRKFSAPYNLTQSGRGLGFDTNYDPYFTGCRAMSKDTFLHLGYTGTQFCISPSHDVYTIFLTNRVYPLHSNFKIEPVRNKFNTAVWNILFPS